MASNPYVNKVVYGSNTVMDISDTTATESDVLAGKEFYKANGEKASGTAVIPSVEDCYQTTDTVATEVDDADYIPFYDSSATAKKNSLWSNIKSRIANALLPVSTKNVLGATLENLKFWNSSSSGSWSGGSYTINGLTFACYSNSTTRTIIQIGVSGTASATTSLITKAYLESGDYILSGCTGGSSTTYWLEIPSLGVTSYSGDTAFTVTNSATYEVRIYCYQGYSISESFFPMIRPAVYKDSTFKAPVWSNALLTKRMPRWVSSSYNFSGTITFTNVYDDGNFAYEVYFWTDANTQNKSPYAKLTTISGTATSRTLAFETDADNGKLGYLLQIPVDY